MAACGSLQQIFDNILPENQTLIETLSWNQIKALKPFEQPPSLTEIFGELHFKENTPTSSSSSSTTTTSEKNHTRLNQNEDSSGSPSTESRHKGSDSFSSLSTESLQLCTEGLGFESSDEVEDLMSGSCWKNDEHQNEKEDVKKNLASLASDEVSYCAAEYKRGRMIWGGYPPPISCIGRTGKPCVWFKSFRSNGRFILKEIRIPSQEFLHACRENGRLKLHFVQPDDEDPEEEYDDDDDEEEEEEEDYVAVMDDEEENLAKENHGFVKDNVNG